MIKDRQFKVKAASIPEGMQRKKVRSAFRDEHMKGINIGDVVRTNNGDIGEFHGVTTGNYTIGGSIGVILYKTDKRTNSSTRVLPGSFDYFGESVSINQGVVERPKTPESQEGLGGLNQYPKGLSGESSYRSSLPLRGLSLWD